MKLKNNCLLLYGKKHILYLEEKNLLLNKIKKNLITEILE